MKPRSPLHASSPKAALYLRVSTGPQTEGTSLAGQLLACRQKADQLGAEVVGVFEDVQSGADYSDRIALQNALAQIERGEADTLIIYDMTRYSRDLGHQQLIKKRVMSAGARLEFATFDVGDLSTPEAHLSFGVRGVFAEYERLNTRERTTRGRRARANEGIQPCRTYRPFGYDLVTKADIMAGRFTLDQLGRYLVREEEAVWVRQIFERFSEGSSLRQVQTWLTTEGPPSPRAGTQWHFSTVRRILCNPIYKGEATFGRLQRLTDESRLEQGLKKHYMRETPLSARVTIAAPAIVSLGVWEQCQTLLRTNQSRYSGRKSHRWLLSSLVKCPICGASLIPWRTGKQHGAERQKLLSDEEDVVALWAYRRAFYRLQCSKSLLVVDKTKRCSTASIGVSDAEAQVIEQVLAVATRPELLSDYIRHKQETVRAQQGHNRERITRLESDLSTLQSREQAVLSLQIRAVENGLDPSLYDKSLREFSQERRTIEDTLKSFHNYSGSSDLLHAQEKAKEITGLLSQVEGVLLAPEDVISPHEKNRLLHMVLDRVEFQVNGPERTVRVVWKGVS